MPSPSDSALPRCLLCSMHCVIGAKDDGLGHISTVYPADLGVDEGACVRGLTAARLLSAPERIFSARQAGEPASTGDVLEHIERVVSRAEGPEVGVIVDVNRPLEGVLGMAELCRQTGARLAAFAPPEDLALLQAGLTRCPPFAGMADCDRLLAVGDPFGSHPAIAGRVRDVQFAARGNMLISIDAASGRTGRAADEAVVIPPTKLAAFMAALAIECGANAVQESMGGMTARQICDDLDLPGEQIAAFATDLKEAKAPGIILSHTLGRYSHGDAVAAAVRELAVALGCQLWPLLVATNSAALPYLQQRFGAVDAAQILRAGRSGDLEVLLIVGWDPASVLPGRLWQQLHEHCETICWAGSLESPFAEVADVVLPLAVAWEEQGTVLDPTGKPAAFEPWLPKPEPVLSVAEIAERMASAAGLEGARAASVEQLVSLPAVGAPTAELIDTRILEAPEPGDGEAILVGSPEPQGCVGGISLAASTWQQRLVAEETATVSADLAQAEDLGESGLLTVRDEVEFAVPYRTNGGAGRVVAMPTHWNALRELLQWPEADGAMAPDPALVQIEKCE